MSQVYKSLISGPVPPNVPTSFGVMFDDAGGQPGLVTPSNNKVYVDGTNGIITRAQTTDAADDTIQIGFANGEATTSDGAGQTQTALQFTTTTNSAFTVTALFSAFEPATNLAFGGRLLIICKNVAGVVSIVAELENIDVGDAAIAACSFTAAGAGALLNLNVTGIAGRTINWTVITPGITGAD